MKKKSFITSSNVANFFLACLWFFLSGERTSNLGQNPPPGPTPNPLAPVLNMPMPLGMQQGTSLDLLLSGTHLAGPTALLTGFPAKATISSPDKKGQDNSKLKVHLEVPTNVSLGYYPLRLATERGMSNLRLFCIDDLPQVLKTDSNQKIETPQSVPIPCVVVGRTDAETGAFYKISVKAGQRVSFDVLGRRLGSPIDPQISLYSARSKREIAHDNDAPGCQTDPRLTHVFKEAGDYILEIKDVLNRGGPDYVYRLRIGDFPLATVPIPMAAKRGTKTKIHFAGPQVEGVLPMEIDVPADPAVPVVWVAPKGPGGLHGWPVALVLSDLDELEEKEPNNEPAQANRIPVPAGVTGRFQHSDDTDFYVFAAKRGQKISITAQTLEWYAPSLVYIVLRNAKTKAEIAKSNPEKLPPEDQRIEFSAAEDGDYLLEVQNLTFTGGPSEAYHLTIVPSSPGFDITLDSDRFDLGRQSFVPLNLKVNRRGYTGPIEVTLHGLGGKEELTGSTTVKAGQNTGFLMVTAGSDVPVGAYNLTLLAKATIDGRVIVQPVSVKGAVSASLSGLPYPPLQLNQQLALAVKDKALFTLVMKVDPSELVPGLSSHVTVNVTRDPGFDGEIVLNPPTGLPANTPAPKLVNIPKDKNETKFQLDVNAKTPLGEYVLFLTGKGKGKDREFSAPALPLPLLVGHPFELKIEPAFLSLKPGDKTNVKISSQRKGGYKGPIAVDFRKLPAGVTANKSVLAMDQMSIEVEISAAANAEAVEKKDVDVNGTATALNNLQNASPIFTVRVEKK